MSGRLVLCKNVCKKHFDSFFIIVAKNIISFKLQLEKSFCYVSATIAWVLMKKLLMSTHNANREQHKPTSDFSFYCQQQKKMAVKVFFRLLIASSVLFFVKFKKCQIAKHNLTSNKDNTKSVWKSFRTPGNK